jgi:hypothetical protein
VNLEGNELRRRLWWRSRSRETTDSRFAVSLFRQRQAASNITTQVCDDSGTLIVIMANYAVELRAGWAGTLEWDEICEPVNHLSR